MARTIILNEETGTSNSVQKWRLLSFTRSAFSDSRFPSGIVVRGTLWASLSRATIQIGVFARLVLLARFMAPSDFGLVGIALLIIAFLDAFTEPGLTTTLIQRRGKIDEYLTVAFTFQVIRCITLSGVVVFAAVPVGAFFDAPNIVSVIQAIAIIVLLQGFVSPATVLLHRKLQFKKMFFWNVGEVVVGFVAALALALMYRDVWAMVGSLIFAQVARVIGSFVVAPWRPGFSANFQQLRELTGFGRWVNFSNIVVFLSLQGDNAFVGKFLGTTALGIYQLAFRLSQLPAEQVSQIIAMVAFPSLSAVSDQPERLRTAYLRVFSMLLVVNLLIVLILFLSAAPLVRLVFGPQWNAAIPVLHVLVLAGFIRSLATVGGHVFYAAGTPRWNLVMNLLRLSVFAATVYPFSRLWGIMGVATSVTLSLAAIVPLYFLGIRRVLNLTLQDHLHCLSLYRLSDLCASWRRR